MLYLKRLTVLFFVSFLIMFSSCKKDTFFPMFTNNAIIGSAAAITPGSVPTYTGITVKEFGPYGNSVIMTDEQGKFNFFGLGNGTYRFEYSMEGYGTVNEYNIQLFSHDTAYASGMLFKRYDEFELPVLLNVSVGTGGFPASYVVIETGMSSSTGVLPDPLPVIVFIDSLNTVSFKNSSGCHPPISPAFSRTNQGEIVYLFDTEGLPFSTGKEVFFIAYVCNPQESGIDAYLGAEHFSTLLANKHSDVKSFVMP